VKAFCCDALSRNWHIASAASASGYVRCWRTPDIAGQRRGMAGVSCGTITIEARQGQESGRDWLTVAVADTGIGMTAEQMSKLFQEFKG
jgi:histidine kinase/DNA gyrase B/HSP90-like ATPase